MTTAGTHRRVASVFLLVGLVSAAPLWIFPFLPSQDLPAHLSIIAALADEAEPGWHDRFEDRRALAPYVAVYDVAARVARVVGADATGRLALTLVVVLLPLSVAAVLTTYRPGTEWVALLAVPLTYSDSYSMGFLNYLLSLPLLFFSVALALATLHGGRRAPFAFALCLLATCYTHPVSIGIFSVIAATWLCFRAVDLRAFVAFGIACLPTAFVFGRWLVEHPAEIGFRIPALYKLSYLLTAPAFILDAGGVVEALIVLACIAALALSIVASAMRERSRHDRHRPFRELASQLARGGWLAFLGVLALYWIMPFSRDQTVWVDLRLATPVWMMLITCAAGALTGSRLRAVLVAVLVATYLVGVVRVHRAFAAEAAPLSLLLADLPENARLLPILMEADSRTIDPSHKRADVIRYSSPYAHFVSWYHLQKGGESPYMAFHHTMKMIPVALRSPFYRHKFGPGEIFQPRRFLSRLPDVAPRFDFIVVRVGSLQGLGAIEEVATLYSSHPPFHAFAVKR